MGIPIRCNKCGKYKEVSDYYPGRKTCKDCRLEIDRAYQASHRKECSARKAEYRSRFRLDEFRRGRQQKYNTSYYLANRERLKRASALYRENNPSKAAKWFFNRLGMPILPELLIVKERQILLARVIRSQRRRVK